MTRNTAAPAGLTAAQLGELVDEIRLMRKLAERALKVAEATVRERKRREEQIAAA